MAKSAEKPPYIPSSFDDLMTAVMNVKPEPKANLKQRAKLKATKAILGSKRPKMK
jgi:hypothetical protein